jgi:tetratricopeptide (TPR) repeat protein
MRVYRFLITIAAAFLLLVILTEPSKAKDRWINVQTKNFDIISNADEKNTRDLALQLEQFRYTFTKIYPDTPLSEPIPVTVFIFKDSGSFKPFKPFYKGKQRKEIGGYFKQGEDENIIALDLTSDALRIIFHEYTHLLTSYSTIELPVWINEGLAELYSSFEMEKNEAVLGTPLATHVHYLRSNDLKLLPLNTLINVDKQSPIYNESDKASFLYTQSWVFVHYLMLGDKGAHKHKLFKYIKLLRSGLATEDAFRQSFNVSFEEMEHALRIYMSNNIYPVVKFRLDTTLNDKDYVVRQIGEAEAQTRLGFLLLRIEYIEEAEKYFKRASEFDPNFSGIEEGLGFIAIKRNQFGEAIEHFRKAAAHGSKNYLAHYQHAYAIYQNATKDKTVDISSEQLALILESIKVVINLKPEFAPSYHLIGLAHLKSGKNYDEGAKAVSLALNLAPRNKQYVITLAQLQIRLKDFEGAKKILQPLLSEDDPELKSSAKSLLEIIDSQIKPD